MEKPWKGDWEGGVELPKIGGVVDIGFGDGANGFAALVAGLGKPVVAVVVVVAVGAEEDENGVLAIQGHQLQIPFRGKMR